jgi:hypothetical protein
MTMVTKTASHYRHPSRKLVLIRVLINIAFLLSHQSSLCCWALPFLFPSRKSTITRTIPNNDSSLSLLPSLVVVAAKKRNGSGGGGGMAEKRARRQVRQQRIVPTNHLPKSNLGHLVDGNNNNTVTTSPSPSSAAKTKDFDNEIHATMTKAQELLQRQRESVAMLTLVREKVEKLPAHEISDALQRDGFYVHDNLLLGHTNSKDSQDADANRASSSVVFESMQKEGLALLDTSLSQPDINCLASGEYICNLQGGEEQYKTCPRSIEWVVSVTKHLPEMLNKKKSDGSDDDDPSKSSNKLDTQKCIGLMRTFDRKAEIAARKLLVAADDNDDVEDLTPRSFGLATEGATDLKQLSMRYYLVPNGWDDSMHGGGLAFQKGNHGDGNVNSAEIVHVDAVCDRLVLWKSHETRYHAKPWLGDAHHESASCIELHLLRKE